MVINRIEEKVDILTHLLPVQEHLQFQNYELDPEQRQVRVFVDSVQHTVLCPVCGHSAIESTVIMSGRLQTRRGQIIES